MKNSIKKLSINFLLQLRQITTLRVEKTTRCSHFQTQQAVRYSTLQVMLWQSSGRDFGQRLVNVRGLQR